MDPFVTNTLILVAFLAVFVPLGAWLMPKLDHASNRIEAWIDARRARRTS